MPRFPIKHLGPLQRPLPPLLLRPRLLLAETRLTKDHLDAILIETTANGVDIKMSKKLKKDFLNVDDDAKKEETKTGEINIESKLNERREELRNFTFEFLMPEDLSSILQTDTEYKVVEPTVDEILEKITEEGIESLTETEKEILDNYGKRKNGGN